MSTSSRSEVYWRWRVTRRKSKRLSLAFVPLIFVFPDEHLRAHTMYLQNKEHEAKEELKRRAKQLEVQRREMTRRGQNPYSTNSSAGFSQTSTYVPATPSYDAPRIPSYDAPAANAKPFKTKGMQLGAKGGRKADSGLAEALGGLNVDDEPLLPRHIPQEEVVTPQQATTPVPSGKEVNPFGPVDEEEFVPFSRLGTLCLSTHSYSSFFQCASRYSRNFIPRTQPRWRSRFSIPQGRFGPAYRRPCQSRSYYHSSSPRKLQRINGLERSSIQDPSQR